MAGCTQQISFVDYIVEVVNMSCLAAWSESSVCLQRCRKLKKSRRMVYSVINAV